MILNPEELSVKENYKLLIGSILPRPIALVSSHSPQGDLNLAPFSFFTAISSSPPTICFSPASKARGQKKDTLHNVETSGEFVVNIVTEDIAPQMNETATDFPPEVDEFEMSGLTPEPSALISVPGVAESPVRMECKKYKIIHIGEAGAGGGSLVIGKVVLFHIDDNILSEGRIDTGLLKPVGRLAGMEYTTLGQRFTLERKKFNSK